MMWGVETAAHSGSEAGGFMLSQSVLCHQTRPGARVLGIRLNPGVSRSVMRAQASGTASTSGWTGITMQIP